MNSLIPFDFDQQPIRAVADEAGNAWFVGKDVAQALGYSDTINALKQHCRGVVKHHPLPTPGGIQNVRLISEPDLYRLVVGSRLPAAERFERWVFEEVLPTIRRTGSYFAQPAAADMRGVNTAFWLIPTAVRAARSLGLPREAAIVAANRTIAGLTGVDALQLLDIEPPALPAPETRPETRFMLAWQNGAAILADDLQPLPFVPCTGRQLYTAFRLWCRAQDIVRPIHETLFISGVARLRGWQAGRAVATWAAPGSSETKNRKMVIPPSSLTDAPQDTRMSDWLTDGYFTFQAALDAAQTSEAHHD